MQAGMPGSEDMGREVLPCPEEVEVACAGIHTLSSCCFCCLQPHGGAAHPLWPTHVPAHHLHQPVAGILGCVVAQLRQPRCVSGPSLDWGSLWLWAPGQGVCTADNEWFTRGRLHAPWSRSHGPTSAALLCFALLAASLLRPRGL